MTCGRVEFGADATPTGSKFTSNNYIIRCHEQFELVGVSLLGFELHFEAVRTSSQQRAWVLTTPGWAAKQNEKRSAAVVRGTEDQYVAVFSFCNSPLTHNPFTTLFQPFRIKCERYIFLKKCVRSSLLSIMFLHIYVYVYLYHRYTTYLYLVPKASHAHPGMVSSLNRRSKKRPKRESETECNTSKTSETREEKLKKKHEKKEQTSNEEQKKEKKRETPKTP